MQFRYAILRITKEKLTVFEGCFGLLVSLEIAEHGSIRIRVRYHSFIRTPAPISILWARIWFDCWIHLTCNRREAMVVPADVEV